MKLWQIWFCVVVLLVSGCVGGGSNNGDKEDNGDGLTDEQFGVEFADKALALWLGTDYTYGGDGSSGIDGAGTVFATLQDMNYAVPNAVSDGIHENYDITTPDPVIFNYTLTTPVATPEQIQGGDFSTLQKGDLIFLDYDFDDVWDHVVIYLGAYDTFTHAAFTASDFYDECVVSDLDDYNYPLAQDIEWSQVSAMRLDHAVINATYSQ